MVSVLATLTRLKKRIPPLQVSLCCFIYHFLFVTFIPFEFKPNAVKNVNRNRIKCFENLKNHILLTIEHRKPIKCLN